MSMALAASLALKYRPDKMPGIVVNLTFLEPCMTRSLRTLAFSAILSVPALASAAMPVIDVFKTETCGCCDAWVTHLKANGFTVKLNNVANPADYRQKFGIPDGLGSCHTAKIAGYAIEGHVPAREIKRLLASGVKARGLAVPAMPLGSPGMEAARSEPYDVLLVQPNGRTTIYKHYTGKS
jgi:hypothetical protein